MANKLKSLSLQSKHKEEEFLVRYCDQLDHHCIKYN